MNKNIWAKTILTAYRYLEKIAGAIDRLVEQTAESSFYVTAHNFYATSVSVIAEKLIELSERKIKLINLKVLTEMALELCEPACAKILIEKYVDGDKAADIVERSGLSMRTYFRRMGKAEKMFSYNLACLGFSDEKLKDYLENERWINEIYCSYNVGEGEDVSVVRLEKLALLT